MKVFSAVVLVLSVVIALAGLGTAFYFQHAPELAAALSSPTTALAAIPIPPPASRRTGAIEPAPAASERPPSPDTASDAALPAAEIAAPPLSGQSAPPPGPVLPEPSTVASTVAAPGSAAAPPDTVAASPPDTATTGAIAIAPPPPPTPTAETTATAMPSQIAALEVPRSTLPEATAPTPADAASGAPRFWVEYGVYARRHYADNLQKNLAKQGLDTVVVRTHTPNGRPLLRVRSAHPIDRAAAENAAAAAQRSVKIAALIHRLPADAGGTIAVNSAKPVYWVTLGGFNARQSAATARRALAQHGIRTSLYSARDKSDKPMFYLRSLSSADRPATAELAARAAAVVGAPARLRMSSPPPVRMAPQGTGDAPATAHGPLAQHTG